MPISPCDSEDSLTQLKEQATDKAFELTCEQFDLQLAKGKHSFRFWMNTHPHLSEVRNFIDWKKVRTRVKEAYEKAGWDFHWWPTELGRLFHAEDFCVTLEPTSSPEA
jgi:hypothetical protein